MKNKNLKKQAKRQNYKMIKKLVRITTNLIAKKQFTKRKLKNAIYKKSTTKILRDQQVKKKNNRGKKCLT